VSAEATVVAVVLVVFVVLMLGALALVWHWMREP
jgi:hypothetical protein